MMNVCGLGLGQTSNPREFPENAGDDGRRGRADNDGRPAGVIDTIVHAP